MKGLALATFDGDPGASSAASVSLDRPCDGGEPRRWPGHRSGLLRPSGPRPSAAAALLAPVPSVAPDLFQRVGLETIVSGGVPSAARDGAITRAYHPQPTRPANDPAWQAVEEGVLEPRLSVVWTGSGSGPAGERMARARATQIMVWPPEARAGGSGPGGRRELERPADPCEFPEPRLRLSGDGLDAAARPFDQLAPALADHLAGVPAGAASIEDGGPAGLGYLVGLAEVRRGPERSQPGSEDLTS
jgi:hypothetical protein